MRRRRVFNILVLFPWSEPHARELLAGVTDYASTRPWRLVDIMAGAGSDAVLATYAAKGTPDGPFVHVAVRGTEGDVRPDQQAIGRMAAEHFLERGFRHFARMRDADAGAAFDAAVVRAGHAAPRVIDVNAAIARRDAPLAVFCQGGVEAGYFAMTCRQAGLRVPEDVAILCCTEHDPFCVLAGPPISTLDIDPRRVGRAAAARLDRLLRGRPVAAVDFVPPSGQTLRASTDTLAVQDPDVRNAMALLRDSGGVVVRVADLMRAAQLDRRTLERRFRKALGRPPAEVLRRHRAARAADLLRTTDRPVGEIAQACGFRLPQHLAVALRAVYGQTPTDYRASVRDG